MKRSKFIFRENYQQALDIIDDAATKAELLLAITDYGINGNPYHGENKMVQVAMALIMPQIDRENRRYELKNEEISSSNPKDLNVLKDPKDLNNPIDPNLLIAPMPPEDYAEKEKKLDNAYVAKPSLDFSDVACFRIWLEHRAPYVAKFYERSIDSFIFDELLKSYGESLLKRLLIDLSSKMSPNYGIFHYSDIRREYSLMENLAICKKERELKNEEIA